MQQRRFGLTAVGLDKLHALSVELLDLLKENMPYRTDGAEGWNFEKAHSILHKVRDILLFGWSENFSHQGPEHGHIDNCKKLANCTKKLKEQGGISHGTSGTFPRGSPAVPQVAGGRSG